MLSDIRHVFVIVLENESYAATFGSPSNDPYLASTLVGKGALLTDFSRPATTPMTTTSR